VWADVLPRESQQPASARLHVFVAYAPDGTAPKEYAWHDPDVVSAARPEAIQWLRAAADAVASVRTFPDVPVGRAAAPARTDEPDLTFDELRCRAQHANEILRAHLLAADVAPKHKETLSQWADRVSRDGVSQAVSATTRRSRFPLHDDAADDPFNFNSEYFDPSLTQPTLQVPAQLSDFRPSSIKDILHPWAISAIDEWFAREETDLQRYAADPAARRRTNTPLVINQDGSKPRAQGLFWDLRGAVPQLMRRDAPGVISLNADAVRAAAGPAYPDQELLDGIQHGVRMPAAHQLCVVLLPNLILMGGAGMRQHHADVTRMEADRILSVHASMPFIPGVILPQGSIGKIHEPEKRRRITDAGAPRAPLTSRMGTAIVPINVSDLTPHANGSSPMKEERKPRFSHVRGDVKILHSAAKALGDDGEPPEVCRVHAACDYFRAFFHQFGLHTSELSRFLLTLLRDGRIHVASERVLGFGCAPSSGIAQRSPTSSVRWSPLR
jgi:hypothetical protein